jgi:fluoride exporter
VEAAPFGGDEVADDALDPDLEAVPGAAPLPTHGLLVFLGGAAGTFARYALLRAHPSPAAAVDWWLLLVNASGSLALGLLVAALFSRRPHADRLRLLLATGFLGGWTTYSAIMGATLTLAHGGHWGASGLTLLLQVVVPVLAAWLGLLLGGLRGREVA